MQQEPGAPAHLERRAAGKRQQQQPLRIGTLLHQPGQPRRQCQRLATAGAGDHQQRRGRRGVGDGVDLRRVQVGQKIHGLTV